MAIDDTLAHLFSFCDDDHDSHAVLWFSDHLDVAGRGCVCVPCSSLHDDNIVILFVYCFSYWK